MPNESVFQEWRERWLRRGELLTVAALTSLVTSLASGKWIAFGVAFAICLVGVYVICAAEAGWWLPGRNRTLEQAQRDSNVKGQQALMAHLLNAASVDAKAIANEIHGLRRDLRAVFPQQPPEDGEP